jgi:hypothetical protein
LLTAFTPKECANYFVNATRAACLSRWALASAAGSRSTLRPIGLVSGDDAAMLSSSSWRPHGESKLVQETSWITAGASDTTLFQKLPLTMA